MGFFKKEKLTPEQEITKKQLELTRRQIGELKRARRQGSSLGMGKVLGAFGKAFPKGIKSPDSLVTNLHLYKPGLGRKKTILK